MAATTVSIASDSTKGAHPDISDAIASMLTSHGEAALLSSVAQAIGFRRIMEAAGEGRLVAFRCDDPCSANDRKQSCMNGPGAATPSTRVMTYYDAGCDGAKTLARLLGRSVFKKGFTCQEIPSGRLAGLDEAIYGGWAASAATLDPAQPIEGWSDWQFARYEPKDTAHIIPPAGVTIVDGLWQVRLPLGIDPASFDRCVTALMMPRQLAFWVKSGEGRAHCGQKGLDPEQFVRFALDAKRGLLRPVEELYVYSPRRDAAWFAAILGEALALASSGILPH